MCDIALLVNCSISSTADNRILTIRNHPQQNTDALITISVNKKKTDIKQIAGKNEKKWNKVFFFVCNIELDSANANQPGNTIIITNLHLE